MSLSLLTELSGNSNFYIIECKNCARILKEIDEAIFMNSSMSLTQLEQINRYFSLSTNVSETQTHIIMKLHIDIVNTRFIPKTFRILKKNFPSVLGTQCFNEEGLPFHEEVKKTEIGHLFEHILLDCLCHEKMAQGYESASFSGRTDWNWERDEKGIFHIFIEAGNEVVPILQTAINSASYHTELILNTAVINTNN